MSRVLLRVDPALRLFLDRSARATGQVAVARDPTASLGHLVEQAGVPLPEVGALEVGGRTVPPSYRPGSADVVLVHPVARPQPLGGPARLLLDVHLGTLARRLRLLGVDVAYRNDADDDELVQQAAAEDRLLLTRDRGLLRRRALRRAAYVRGDRPDAQLADVFDRFALPVAPFSRCPACGGRLHDVAKQRVLHLLEPGTRRTQSAFRQCGDCRRVYWRGAHAARLDALVARYVRGGRGTGPA